MLQTLEELEKKKKHFEAKIKEISAELPDLEGQAWAERYQTREGYKKSLKETELQISSLSKL